MRLPGKWGLHTFYMKDNVIRVFLPDTRIFNKLSLKHILDKYQSVYIKPNMSHMGKGIIKAWKSYDTYTVWSKLRGTLNIFVLSRSYMRVFVKKRDQKHTLFSKPLIWHHSKVALLISES